MSLEFWFVFLPFISLILCEVHSRNSLSYTELVHDVEYRNMFVMWLRPFSRNWWKPVRITS